MALWIYDVLATHMFLTEISSDMQPRENWATREKIRYKRVNDRFDKAID